MVKRPFKDIRPVGPFIENNPQDRTKPEKVPRDTGSTDQRLLSMLQDAHTSEAESIVNYVSVSYNISGPYADDLGQVFRYAANDEFDHLHKFSAMIATVGASPQTSVEMQMVQDQINPTGEYLDSRQGAGAAEALESDAIDSYPDIASYAKQVGYPQFEKVINEIIADEKHHRNLFQTVRQDIQNNPDKNVSKGSIPSDWKTADYGNKD